MTLEQITEERSKSTNPVISVIATAGKAKVMGLAFQAGGGLKEHPTKLPAKLIILEGNVIYKSGNERQALSQYQQKDIPPLELHEVEALTDALCLLIQGHD